MNASRMCDLIRVQDHTAFAELYSSYSPALFTQISRMVRCRETAEDLLQDVFVSIWQKGHQYNLAKGSLYTWMLTITRNRCIDHLRKSGYTMYGVIDEMPAEDNTRCPDRNLELSLVYKRLESIRPSYLELFRLVYVYGYTYEEASKKCEIPIGTIKTVLRNVIKKHKVNLKEN